MKAATQFDLHFAVVSGTPDGTSFSVTAPVIYGTAFPLAPGLFATAAHVIKAAASDGEPALVRFDEQNQLTPDVKPVTEAETVDAIDFALLRVPGFDDYPYLWPVSFETLSTLGDVSAQGFPAALDPQFLSVSMRAFKGYIVTGRQLLHMPGQPGGYELSFPASRGLSGAPLIAVHSDGASYCHGYVVQHMDIDADEQSRVSVGIAVASDAMLSVHSKLLKGNLASLWGEQFRGSPRKLTIRNPLAAPPDSDRKGWPDDMP